MGTLAAPVIGIVASSLLSKEKIGVLEGIGMCLILAALLVLTLRGLAGGIPPGLPQAAPGHLQPKE